MKPPYISRRSNNRNDFRKKLDGLEQSKFISEPQKEILLATFDAGSAASHRGFKPNEADVTTALEVVENLMQLDSLGVKAEILKENTPQRNPNK